jgi:hypothetical protein
MIATTLATKKISLKKQKPHKYYLPNQHWLVGTRTKFKNEVILVVSNH